jgi:2,4-dienoyl-CoA reductase-like NADH-dependent reductase (Old Yellow Enzyme family)
LDALFQPLTIGSVTLPNRFVRSATWLGLAAAGGAVTPEVEETYERLAGGGLGLIITGFAFVSREGQGPAGQLGIHDDALVDGLRRIVERVHARGALIAVQIVHCGEQSRPENSGGREVIGPSEERDAAGNLTARAMRPDEIARVVADFGAAARRARAAGFDAVQLHFAHGYLASQFLSPRRNRRRDAYGGALDDRLRFHREVLASVRGAVGEDYPVLAKLNVEDFCEGGLEREEGIAAAAALTRLGLDAIEVSGGTRDSGNLGAARRNIRSPREEAYFLENAVAVRKATGKPVILVGGLRSPGRIAEIHRETGIDAFALSRPLIREPHLVREWREGRTQPSACVSCSTCLRSIKYGRGVFCVKAGRGSQAG